MSEHLNKETFRDKVFNFEKNRVEIWGDPSCTRGLLGALVWSLSLGRAGDRWTFQGLCRESKFLQSEYGRRARACRDVWHTEYSLAALYSCEWRAEDGLGCITEKGTEKNYWEWIDSIHPRVNGHSMKQIILRLKEFLAGSMWRKRILFSLLGALGGYAYYYFVGCRTGTCPISSNPWISTVYGASMGFILTVGERTKA